MTDKQDKDGEGYLEEKSPTTPKSDETPMTAADTGEDFDEDAPTVESPAVDPQEIHTEKAKADAKQASPESSDEPSSEEAPVSQEEDAEEEPPAPRPKFYGIRFRDAGRLYYFMGDEIAPPLGANVIVEAERGVALGKVVCAVDADEHDGHKPKRSILRIANQHDQQTVLKNRENNIEAKRVCQQFIAKLKLPMKLIEVRYQHSSNKAVFYFSAEGRIDFRELVRMLAQELRIRVEMRQVGIRDEAKLVGGIGPCGRMTCCTTFLDSFIPVSIRMAKQQNLALNPEKVSGLCGRLMCCLAYESDFYKEVQKGAPKIGKKTDTWLGKGRVLEINIFSRQIRLELENREYVSLSIDDIKAYRDDPEAFKKVLEEREKAERDKAIERAVKTPAPSSKKRDEKRQDKPPKGKPQAGKPDKQNAEKNQQQSGEGDKPKKKRPPRKRRRSGRRKKPAQAKEGEGGKEGSNKPQGQPTGNAPKKKPPQKQGNHRRRPPKRANQQKPSGDNSRPPSKPSPSGTGGKTQPKKNEGGDN